MKPVNLAGFRDTVQHGVLVVQCVERDFVFSSCRLHTAQRAIKQTQVTVQKIGKEIEEKLRTTATCTERVSTVARQQRIPAHPLIAFKSAAVLRQLIFSSSWFLFQLML